MAFLPSTHPTLPLPRLSTAADCTRRPARAVTAPRRAVRCCTSTVPADRVSTPRLPTKTQIKLVASDVDGTLLNSHHEVADGNADAIRKLLAAGTDFVPATGKSRVGAYRAMGTLADDVARTYGGERPGVFLQGLIVYGRDGAVVYEQVLTEEFSRKVVEIAKANGITFIAYAGDRILCEQTDAFTDALTTYHEPAAEPMGDFLQNVIGKYPLHKFLFLDTEERISAVRKEVEKAIDPKEATITQAIADMLEILPPGASKGLGVEKLLESWGLEQTQLLAIGDAENDLEMLRNAGIGCAVANALPMVKKVADVMVVSNNEGGVGQAIETYAF